MKDNTLAAVLSLLFGSGFFIAAESILRAYCNISSKID